MRNRYLKNISFFLSASILAKVAGGFSTFFVAKTLQPADFGIWLTMLLFYSLSPILTFGVIETLLKQFPFYKGKGEAEMALRLEYVVFTSTILTASGVLSGGCIFTVLAKWAAIECLEVPILFLTVAASLSFPSQYFYFRFIAHQDFRLSAMLDLIRSLLNSILIISFSYFWGITGAAVGFCLNETMICAISAIINYRSYGKLKLLFDFRAIWGSIVVGMPITIFWWLFVVRGTIDRMLSISMLGKTATGYYGLGNSIVSVLFLLPESISKVFYPRINEKFGETSNKTNLFRIVTLPTYFISLLLSGGIGLMVILLPIVYSVFPKYLPGLASGQILVFISFFPLINSNGINFLIATNRQNQLCLMIIANLCVSLTVSYGAIWFGLGIEGLALSAGFSGAFFSCIVWRSVFAGMGFACLKQLMEIGKLLIPFGLMALLLGLGILICREPFIQANAFIVAYSAIFVILYAACVFLIPLTRRWLFELINVFRDTSSISVSANQRKY